MSTRRLRIQLEVEVEVDDDLLEENSEEMTDEQVAKAIETFPPSGSFLSVADEAIEIIGDKVIHVSRILSKESAG